MADKTINCKDCGSEFVFTEGEQQFYTQMGFDNEPTRCKDCRAKKKAQKNSSGRRNGFNAPRMSRY